MRKHCAVWHAVQHCAVPRETRIMQTATDSMPGRDEQRRGPAAAAARRGAGFPVAPSDRCSAVKSTMGTYLARHPIQVLMEPVQHKAQKLLAVMLATHPRSDAVPSTAKRHNDMHADINGEAEARACNECPQAGVPRRTYLQPTVRMRQRVRTPVSVELRRHPLHLPLDHDRRHARERRL